MQELPDSKLWIFEEVFNQVFVFIYYALAATSGNFRSAHENVWKNFMLLECFNKQESEPDVALCKSVFIIFSVISNLQ